MITASSLTLIATTIPIAFLTALAAEAAPAALGNAARGIGILTIATIAFIAVLPALDPARGTSLTTADRDDRIGHHQEAMGDKGPKDGK